EQRPERLRLEELAPRAAGGDAELGEDLPRLGRPRLLPFTPEAGEPVAQLVVAVGAVEHPADDELRRHGAVPPVLLEAEDEVVPRVALQAVELRPEPE